MGLDLVSSDFLQFFLTRIQDAFVPVSDGEALVHKLSKARLEAAGVI